MNQIQIRVDFERRGFCLFTNGEAVGAVFARYTAAWLSREWLIGEAELRS